MPVFICGNEIRLTGKDANNFLEETGRYNLPKTKSEYNKALKDAIEYWKWADCAEGRLLAALLENKLEI